MNILTRATKREELEREHFAQVYRLAFIDSSENFIKHPDFAIMDYISEEEVNAVGIQDKENLFMFNVGRLLLGYNRWKGTHLQINEVAPLCRIL